MRSPSRFWSYARYLGIPNSSQSWDAVLKKITFYFCVSRFFSNFCVFSWRFWAPQSAHLGPQKCTFSEHRPGARTRPRVLEPRAMNFVPTHIYVVQRMRINKKYVLLSRFAIFLGLLCFRIFRTFRRTPRAAHAGVDTQTGQKEAKFRRVRPRRVPERLRIFAGRARAPRFGPPFEKITLGHPFWPTLFFRVGRAVLGPNFWHKTPKIGQK